MIKNEGKSIYNIHKDGKDISQVVSKLETVFDNRIPYSNLLAYYNAKGKTNQDVDRAVLSDLTGNGYDLNLLGFSWNNTSGYNNDSLVFDGVKDFAQSVIQLPAFTDNNYTIVLDVDIIGTTGYLIYKLSRLFMRVSGSNYIWYNLTSGFGVNATINTIAFTNNIAYLSNGNRVISTDVVNNNSNGILTLGKNAVSNNQYLKFALRSIAIFNGVNLNYEQIMNCYTKMKNNTL